MIVLPTATIPALAKMLAALMLGLTPPQHPGKPSLDSGPAGVGQSAATAPAPVLYSGARYPLFIGWGYVTATYMRPSFTVTPSSPYRAIEGPRSGMARYHGARR
jgi:hypothetical protein